MNPQNDPPVALHLLFEDEVGAWRVQQTERVQRWAQEHGWNAEKNRVLLIPDEDGSLTAAAYGLGRRQGEISLWHAAGMPERLPARRFKLMKDFQASESTQICLGFAYGSYRFERYRHAAQPHLATLEPPANADRQYVTIVSAALALGRDYINTPAADFGPAQLCDAARTLAARHCANSRVWEGEELLSANFPAIHAVGRASPQAPRLVEVRWVPAQTESLPQIVIVGKGVCFDSGGLDIKSAAGMLLMKKDMGGAAAALALADMLMQANIRAGIRLLIPAVENSISGNAFRPGDVLSTRKGLSVEVGNTDAEGRLILCDALAFADEEESDLIIDFATLTGAARVALGPELPAVFSNDDAIVGELQRYALEQHDPIWPMPLWLGYDDELASKVADLNNVAASPFAGAIFGALFLKRFVTRAALWIHVDLYAWNPKERPGRAVGAEIQSVRAFFSFLIAKYGTYEKK